MKISKADVTRNKMLKGRLAIIAKNLWRKAFFEVSADQAMSQALQISFAKSFSQVYIRG
jgi:hypothetical protein